MLKTAKQSGNWRGISIYIPKCNISIISPERNDLSANKHEILLLQSEGRNLWNLKVMLIPYLLTAALKI